MRDYDATVKNLREAAKGLLFDAMPYRASVMQDAADAIEELLGQHEADAKEIAWLKKCVQDLPKPQKWISVKKQLPKDGEFVLVCNDDGHMMIAKHESEVLEWYYKYTNYDFDIWENEEQGPICYWMPLPEPPTDPKGE